MLGRPLVESGSTHRGTLRRKVCKLFRYQKLAVLNRAVLHDKVVVFNAIALAFGCCLNNKSDSKPLSAIDRRAHSLG
jgi:hypothetical protein